MWVRNTRLFNALGEVLGSRPVVGSAGTVAAWSMPSTALTGFDTAREYVGDSKTRLKRAQVGRGGFGEIYLGNCPCCGDTRNRLCVSHVSFARMLVDSAVVEFGLSACCYNESCQSLKKDLWRSLVWRPLWDRLHGCEPVSEDDMMGEVEGSGLKKRPGSSKAVSHGRSATAPTVPKGAVPVSSPDLPGEVLMYLNGRGFDPEYLYSEFGVVACAPWSEYKLADGTLKKLWDWRVVAPIYQGNAYCGWQGRTIDPEDKETKYFFPIGVDRNTCLYNKDAAKFRSRILVTEGVTNVWSFCAVCDEQSSAIASFGKSLSDEQMASMSALWGFHDNIGVLCLDPDAAHLLPKTVDRMLEKKCFGGGLAVMLLPDKEDPASMCESGRCADVVKAFDDACARACFDRMKILKGLEGRIAAAASAAAKKGEKKRQQVAFDIV